MDGIHTKTVLVEVSLKCISAYIIDQLNKGHNTVSTKRSIATFSGTYFYRGASTLVADFKSTTSSDHS